MKMRCQDCSTDFETTVAQKSSVDDPDYEGPGIPCDLVWTITCPNCEYENEVKLPRHMRSMVIG